MIINSKRFGQVEVDQDRIINFKEGLLGFPNFKNFFLVDDPTDPTIPFKWLIPMDNPEISFLVTDPGIFFKDFIFDLSAKDQNALGAQSEDDISVICLLTVPIDAKRITANLRGPLVINWRTLQGRQIVLENTNFTTKHYIFIQDVEKASEPKTVSETAKNVCVAAPSKEESKDLARGAGN